MGLSVGLIGLCSTVDGAFSYLCEKRQLLEMLLVQVVVSKVPVDPMEVQLASRLSETMLEMFVMCGVTALCVNVVGL